MDNTMNGTNGPQHNPYKNAPPRIPKPDKEYKVKIAFLDLTGDKRKIGARWISIWAPNYTIAQDRASKKGFTLYKDIEQ